MSEVQYVTYYTPRYKRYFPALQASCQKFDLNLYAQKYPEFENWNTACGFKPFFIQRMLMKYREQPAVVWIDVDAEFLAYPQILENPWGKFIPHNEHVAVYHTNESQRQSGMHRFGAGTMWFRGSVPAQQYVALWCEKQWIRGPGNDQAALEDAADELGNPFPLPRSYREKSTGGEIPEDTVIAHFMGSRKYRNK